MDIDQFKQFYTFTLRINFCVLFLVSVLAEKCYNVHVPIWTIGMRNNAHFSS